MGIPGQMDAPELLAAFDAVIAAARENKISAAILAADLSRFEPLSARGFDFIAVGSDSSLMRGAARAASGAKF
jgi:2-dehydro-3-deoxyglucarate aldolase/4-hydroxy-2-oxoheptanedioate aldolase